METPEVERAHFRHCGQANLWVGYFLIIGSAYISAGPAVLASLLLTRNTQQGPAMADDYWAMRALESAGRDRDILYVSGTLGMIFWIAAIIFTVMSIRSYSKNLHGYTMLLLWTLLTAYAIYAVYSGGVPTRDSWRPVF